MDKNDSPPVPFHEAIISSQRTVENLPSLLYSGLTYFDRKPLINTIAK